MPRVDTHSRTSLTRSLKRWASSVRRHKLAAAQSQRLVNRRRAQLKALQGRQSTQRQTALRFLHDRLGRHEDHGRQNRAKWLDEWARKIGPWMVGQPWCGLTVWMAARAAGVRLDPRTVSTVAIRDMAKAGTGGFKAWRPWVAGVKLDPGDVLVYGSPGSGPVHTGMYAGAGLVYEGNTSPGQGGSQNNGGGLYPRKLSDRAGWILGVAVIDWKE